VNNPIYRTDLTHRQWQLIKDLLPPPKPGGRPRTVCLHQAFNAMLYLLTTGCQWKMLPQSYPHWRTVYGYFRVWQKDGTWERLHHRLRRWARRQARRRPRPTAGSLDSQSIKSTAVPGVRGFESFKRVMGRKRHIIVDTLGFLLAVCVTPANVSDTAGAVQVLPLLRGCAHRLQLLWCDGGYFEAAFEQAGHLSLKLQPVLRPEGRKGFVLLPKRWVVERTFAWLSRCRRLDREYEVTIESSQALILLAMSRLMLARLAPP
jgi:putative transposase